MVGQQLSQHGLYPAEVLALWQAYLCPVQNVYLSSRRWLLGRPRRSATSPTGGWPEYSLIKARRLLPSPNRNAAFRLHHAHHAHPSLPLEVSVGLENPSHELRDSAGGSVAGRSLPMFVSRKGQASDILARQAGTCTPTKPLSKFDMAQLPCTLVNILPSILPGELRRNSVLTELGQPKTSRGVFRYVAEPIIGRFRRATRRNRGSIKSEMHYPSRPGKRSIGWALPRAMTTPRASHTASRRGRADVAAGRTSST